VALRFRSGYSLVGFRQGWSLLTNRVQVSGKPLLPAWKLKIGLEGILLI
jgi:hypothetical protein